MSPSATVTPVTCLGCGCACDDLTVTVAGGRIAGISPPCPLGQAWFGDGLVPTKVTASGRDAELEAALAEAADLLSKAGERALVVLAADVSVEAQRAALALADLLHATVETATSASAAAGILAAQRRGRATATLGEVRNRADVLLFWAVDPVQRYPRYLSRYAVDPAGTHVPAGRSGRTVISVSVGKDRGPVGAELELALTPDQEIAALSVMRAVASHHPLGELPGPLQAAADAAARLMRARYAVVVHDAEPGQEPTRDAYRAEGLVALAQALNGPTRAALSSLRAGGNRSGAEAALTWQTGFPLAVSYRAGYPRYEAGRTRASRAAGAAAILVVGRSADLGSLPDAVAQAPVIVVGPGASEAPFRSRVAIDTGVAGIHEPGTAYRMDDVPLALRPPIPGGRSAAETVRALVAAVRSRGAGRGR